jgi:hypothetical protein
VELEDIEEIAPGVAGLSPEEHEALQRFTLLWTLFEAQILETNASVKKITKKVNDLEPNILEGQWFQKQLEYFSNRYIENGETNYRFENLHLRKSDGQELVRSVLVGENKDLNAQLIACLTIVYRFRNNYFHGLKWAYEIQEQYDNFSHSANLLKKCLKIFPK